MPDVAVRVGAGHSTLGIALLCLSLGALVCMRFTGAWCARFGAGPVSAVAAVAVSGGAVLPGLVYSVPALCVALLVFGAATGMVNVAANAVGVQVEASVGRPILSGLHAGFSIGGLAARSSAAPPPPCSAWGRTWRSSRRPACSSARGR